MPRWQTVHKESEYQPETVIVSDEYGSETIVKKRYSGYRLVPDFPNYVINNRGDIINVHTGCHLGARLDSRRMWPTVKLRKGIGEKAKSFERSLRKLTLAIFPEDRAEIIEFFDEWQSAFLTSREISRRLEEQNGRFERDFR